MLSYEVTHIEFVGKRGVQATRAKMTLTYRLKPPNSDVILTVPNREMLWIHRHGNWFLGKGPR